MASAAYLALLEQSVVAWRVLVTITAREVLRVWTSSGSSTYSVAFDPYTHPSTIRADRGLYRELVGVRENSTALATKASLAALQAGAGGFYFHDAATGTLYVKTSGSVDPDAVSLMQVEFTVRLATRPLAEVGLPPFDAQVDGQSLPSMRFERPELLRGVVAFPYGDLTLRNGDGFWDYPVAAWEWANAPVRFYAGGEDMDVADYEPLPAMQVVRPPAANDDRAVIQLRSLSNATDRSFPNHTLREFYGAVTGTADVNAYMPVWWGTNYEAPLLYQGDGTSGGRNKFIAGDPFHVAVGVVVSNVVAIERATGARTVLVVSTDYIFFGGADHSVEVVNTYPPADFEIVADLTRSAKTCGQVALGILGACGVSTAEIDTAAFTQADLDNPAVVGLYVAGGVGVATFRSATDLLNELERATLSSVYIGADGKWTMRVWNPAIDLDDILVRTDAELRSWQPVTGVTETLVSTVFVRHSRQIFTDAWATTQSSSEEAIARLASGERSDIIDSCLAAEQDAADLAGRLQLVGSRPTFEVAVTDGPSTMGLVPGDKVRVTRRRGASLVGTFDRVLEVQSITKQLASISTEATLGNQRGLGDLVKSVQADGEPGFDAASADELMVTAYVAEDSGFVDAADASTFRQAVVW